MSIDHCILDPWPHILSVDCKEARWKEPVHYNPNAQQFWCDRDASDWCGEAQDGHEYCFVEVPE